MTTPRVKRALVWLLAVAIVCSGVWAGYLIVRSRRSDSQLAAVPEPAKTVAVYLAARRDLTKQMTLVAELRPWIVTDLYAKVPGYLQTIDVDYGSVVSAGETIATLDVPEQEAELRQAQAAYNLAKVDYDRLVSVVRQTPGLVAQEDIDKAQAAYAEAKDARDRAQVMMDYAVITAPFSGVVTKRFVDPGALIQQGTSSSTQAQPIVRIADTYTLRLVVETPESIVQQIHVGTPVVVRIAATGQVLPERIARYSYDVHEDTRTMHTEVDIPNANMKLKPGMYASVTIDLETHRHVLAVPVQALATDPTPNVWVVAADDTIEQRPVTVGLQTANWVEIADGLKEGDRVFFGSRSSVAIGSKVQPKIENLVASGG